MTMGEQRAMTAARRESGGEEPRRSFLGLFAAIGACVVVLAACGESAATPERELSPPALEAVAAAPAAPAAIERSLCPLVDGPSCPFDHGNFGNPAVIDNPYLPLQPGTRYVYEGTTNEGELLEHQVVITVTDLTKVIDGVESVVTWDLDFSDGELVEAELAFFAQDDDGNVWRMGEHPEEYEDGEFVDAPTWLAGLEGAKAGIAMLGDPALGTLSYSQGWGPEVEFVDRGVVHQIGRPDCVEADCYADVLVVAEFNVLEAGAFQLKYFAPGVGNIRVGWTGTDTTQEELELVSVEQLDAAEMDEVRDEALALEAHAYEISEVYAETEPLERR